MLNVGIINYLNSIPFTAAFDLGVLQPHVMLQSGVPTQLNQKLREGELDVSFISAAEYLCYPELYTLLPDFCIGARERVASVCLYVRESIDRLDGRRVALTPDSASSAMMLRLFCQQHWKISPQFVTLEAIDNYEGYEGFLLLGDQCLRRPQVPGFRTIDLATVWYYTTGLPFTFAVLAARRDSMAAKAVEIAAWQVTLGESLAWSRAHAAEITQLGQQRSQLPLDVLTDYYRLLRFDFDAEQQRGLARFSQLLEETDANVLVP